MGCGASAGINPSAEEESQTVKWKILPSSQEARQRFEDEGTLSKNSAPGHLELRMLLDDIMAQQALGRFAKEKRALEVFMCWIDILEFKAIPTDDYRRSKAYHIYHKYIKPGAVLEVGGIELSERLEYKQNLDLSKEGTFLLTSTFYDNVQTRCFLEIFHNIYQPFRDTIEYISLMKQLKERYNLVRTRDFEYMEKLGEGGFGLVVHCVKKSTGKHYAMKIQTKRGMLDCFADDPWRADFEKQAFASCQHPFIVNMDYAFQNESCAMMVLGLATAGDLQKQLTSAPNERLPEDRVCFYAAEVVLALAYLHEMGLMYRDLKPNNILLCADGHIQLVDLGGVADEKGDVLGKSSEEDGLAPLFRKSFGKHTSSSVLSEADESAPFTDISIDSVSTSKVPEHAPKRKLSIMGTFGYMAPEMVIMLHQPAWQIEGYTDAVDWWSLGVTLFKLLTGFRPFSEENFSAFVEFASTMNPKQAASNAPEYAMLFQEIPFPAYISSNARSLISGLLNVDSKERLGSGPGGVNAIKKHPFFRHIDWNLIEQRHVEPPYKPPPLKRDATPKYPSFEAMLVDLGKGHWLTDLPHPTEQKYFANWCVPLSLA